MRCRIILRPSAFVLMILLLALVTLSPRVNAFPTEIAYDNGILGGNDALPFVGVRFSLPAGVTSAELLTVRFYWLNAGDPVTIHITAADHVTELTTPIQATGGGRTPLFKDLDVSNLGIILTGDFFIILQQYPVSGVQNFGIDTSPKVGRSYLGQTMSDMIPLHFSSSDLGNILLRAVVEPAWNTTSSTAVPQTTSSSSIPELSGVGVLSQSTFILIGVIVVLVVLLVVVMLRRRRPSLPSSSKGAVGDVVYCRKCGTQNAAAQQFCEKCGAKLVK